MGSDYGTKDDHLEFFPDILQQPDQGRQHLSAVSILKFYAFLSSLPLVSLSYFFCFGRRLVPQTDSNETFSPRVYIVDDEWIIAETLATILTRNGFRARAFHNPNQALVRAMDQPPDILLTDVMMPGLDGIEMAVTLRRAGNDCRILLFSGEAGAADLLCDARRRGYDFELLEKPLHPMQLLLRLRNTKNRVSTRRGEEGPVTGADSTSGSIPAA
jgi:CheY-like chemotaxis protein